MILHLYPDADLFGADALGNKIEKDFVLYKQKLIDIFISGKTSEISTTTDIWTSPADIPFMVVTASFILRDGIYFIIILFILFFSS